MQVKEHALGVTQPNDAWILHREEIYTVQDGFCNVYFLLDAYSQFCFDLVTAIDLPSISEMIDIFKKANFTTGHWPKQILIDKSDPYIEMLQSICQKFNLSSHSVPHKSLKPFIQSFSSAFNAFNRSDQHNVEPLPEVLEQELKAFIPNTYGPCPCASGQKFKFCCQKVFYDITFAMSAAEEGNLNEALYYMQAAESKIGRTSEILCRYGICWSFFDEKKSLEYLKEAILLNPNHPRTNYIFGINAKASNQHKQAIQYYQKAIEQYPKTDKYHLNETYNNLGTVYFELEKYQDAKDAWEKALLLLPIDTMARENLITLIYENQELSSELREMSPFVRKYLFRGHA